jgi:acyl-CoA reductase-like NAD-dependent aldehyde dehydrogenase
LAAGNTIVHKPASDTPLTALALAQVILDAGVPEGVYNLITGPGGTLGDALVKHPLVDKVAFTGSTAVGQNIIRNGADTLKDTAMELGGKSRTSFLPMPMWIPQSRRRSGESSGTRAKSASQVRGCSWRPYLKETRS